jgi:hypothetical protein
MTPPFSKAGFPFGNIHGRGCVEKPTMETKQCLKCGEVKATSRFRANVFNPDGYNYFCKQCALIHPKAELAKLGDKKCADCNQIFPKASFRATSPGQVSGYCRGCTNARKRRAKAASLDDRSAGTKTCLKCHEEKSIRQFRMADGNEDGRHHFCKACAKTHPRNELLKLGNKKCITCKEIVPRTEFYIQKGSGKPNRLRSDCIKCVREASKDPGNLARIKSAAEKYRRSKGIGPRRAAMPASDNARMRRIYNKRNGAKVSDLLKTDALFRKQWHAKQNAYASSLREKLADSYILGQLYQSLGIPMRELRKRPDIENLIEIKRLALKLKRECHGKQGLSEVL